MSELKAFLHGLYDIVVFPCWIVLLICLIKMNKRFAGPLFVWGLQPPCLVVLLHRLCNGRRPALGSLVGSGARLSCVFPVGLDRGAVDGGRIPGQTRRFKKAAIWTSAVSVAAHGFFLIVGLVWNALSA